MSGALARLLRRCGLARAEEEDGSPDAAHASGHVIVVGLGPAASEVVRRARERGQRVVVVELAGDALERARALGADAVLGDATFPEVLEHAHVESTAVLVVTTPDAATASLVIRLGRRLAPRLRILARARYSRSTAELQRADADVVVDEEQAVGRDLADLVGVDPAG